MNEKKIKNKIIFYLKKIIINFKKDFKDKNRIKYKKFETKIFTLRNIRNY